VRNVRRFAGNHANAGIIWHALLEMPFLCKQSKQSGQKSFPDTLSDLSLLHIRSNARDKVKDNSVLP